MHVCVSRLGHIYESIERGWLMTYPRVGRIPVQPRSPESENTRESPVAHDDRHFVKRVGYGEYM